MQPLYSGGLKLVQVVNVDPASEPELRDQLYITRAHADSGDLSDLTWADGGIGQGEGRVIQRIAGVGAEVQLEALGNTERLLELHMEILQGRSDYGVSPHIPKSTGRRSRKRVDVVPAIDILAPGHLIRISHHIWEPRHIR